MTSFRYKAMTSSGAVIRGAAEASSEAALLQQLRAEGHYLLSASQAGAENFLELLSQRLRPVSRPTLRGLAMATRELASLLQAGLELDHALSILIGLSDTGALREPFIAIRARIRDGANFAEALGEQSVFPKFYVSMVRAGEYGGALDATLARLADYIGRSLAIREAVTSALIYPVILLVSAGLSIVVILVFVLPEFKPLFAEAGRAMPWPTRMVMGIGDFFQNFWWLLLLAIVGGIFGVQRALKRPHLRLQFDELLLRLPVLGKLLIGIDVERFSRLLGTLLANGVPLPTALGLVKDALWNSVIAGSVSDTAASIREGDGLAERLSQSKAFPASAIDLIRIGEETGKLDIMLLRQADLDEQRIKHTVDRALALLVPALTVILGLIVGGLIASMLVAILSVNDLALQ